MPLNVRIILSSCFSIPDTEWFENPAVDEVTNISRCQGDEEICRSACYCFILSDPGLSRGEKVTKNTNLVCIHVSINE